MAVATRGGSVAGDLPFGSRLPGQHTSAEFRALCDAHGVQQSMGKTGVCWDNALAESFFATYKLELIEPGTWPTRARARTATVHWLEAVYNRQRRHSAIDMQSPVAYEERYWDRRAACSVLEARLVLEPVAREVLPARPSQFDLAFDRSEVPIVLYRVIGRRRH